MMPPPSETWVAADGATITIRPITAADLDLEHRFVDGLSAATGYQRLMSSRRPSSEEIKRFTDVDPKVELALIAVTRVQGEDRQIGVARYVKQQSSAGEAEFAIVLSDDWQGRGLGKRLLESLLLAAKKDGVRRIAGTTLSENRAMLALARKLGFGLSADPGAATITNMTLDLDRWAGKRVSPVDSHSSDDDVDDGASRKRL